MQDSQNSQSHYSLLVSSSGHYLRSLFARKKRPYDEIDSAIKPLVDKMNTVQALQTIASCHGHWFGKPPYVYFKAPVHVAALIERRLREDAMSNSPKLAANWCIHGLFDEKYKQTFLLHAPEYHQGAESLVRAVWLFGARRRHLDTELLTLAQLVEPAMFTDIWQIGRAHV